VPAVSLGIHPVTRAGAGARVSRERAAGAGCEAQVPFVRFPDVPALRGRLMQAFVAVRGWVAGRGWCKIF
jgi:hypothetical protein